MDCVDGYVRTAVDMEIVAAAFFAKGKILLLFMHLFLANRTDFPFD
jgi:hypothetical protein